jgi:IS5 family transposase
VDAGYQGNEKRQELEGKPIELWVAIQPAVLRLLRETSEGGLLDLIETTKAHIPAKVEHPFRVIKQQFGFQKTRLWGMTTNRCKVHVIAALANLYLARRVLLYPL